MVKWCRVYEVIRYYANVLTHNYAITLTDESARLHFTAVKWYRGIIAVWYRGTVVSCHLTTIVAMCQSIYTRGRAASWASCELRAGAATKNLTQS